MEKLSDHPLPSYFHLKIHNFETQKKGLKAMELWYLEGFPNLRYELKLKLKKNRKDLKYLMKHNIYSFL